MTRVSISQPFHAVMLMIFYKPKRDPDSGSDDDEGSSEDSDEDESEDEEDASGMKALLREEGDRARTARKEKKKAEVAELKRLAEARRKKLVKPSRMTSISSGGGAKGGLPFRKEPRKEIKCYKCQRLGHMAKDCPNR